jgi:hypothetical protein
VYDQGLISRCAWDGQKCFCNTWALRVESEWLWQEPTEVAGAGYDRGADREDRKLVPEFGGYI